MADPEMGRIAGIVRLVGSAKQYETQRSVQTTLRFVGAMYLQQRPQYHYDENENKFFLHLDAGNNFKH